MNHGFNVKCDTKKTFRKRINLQNQDPGKDFKDWKSTIHNKKN